jgi:putative MATE family efflux protein
MLMGILVARGHAKKFANIIVVSLFLNIIFDSLFLNGFWIIPPMGISGIALATVLIQFITLIYCIFVVKKYKLINFKKYKLFKPNLKKFILIIKQGVPISTTTILFSVGIIIINYFLGYFGDIYIGAYGVVIKVYQLLFIPTLGLNIAVNNIIAQNNGAKKYYRIHETIYKSLKYGFYVLLVGAFLMFIFSKQIISWFTSNLEIISMGSYGLRILIFASFADLILNISSATLQAIKKPRYGMYFSLFRNILIPAAVFSISYWVFHFGLRGFWWILLIICFTMGISSYYIMKYKLKKYMYIKE